jgi:predicted kinase
MYLAMINGPCGAGKSTISNLLAERLPESLLLSTDELRGTMPEPLMPDALGRDERFALMKDVGFVGRQIAQIALLAGRSVIVDSIMYEDEWFEPWVQLGEACGAQVADICLIAMKDIVIQRALSRDASEESRLTPAKISDLYDKVAHFYVGRPNSFVIRTDELSPLEAMRTIAYHLEYDLPDSN